MQGCVSFFVCGRKMPMVAGGHKATPEVAGMDIFMLWHIHGLADDFGTHEEVKWIGAFSSKERAEEAIGQLKGKEGFRDYPLSCFEIHQSEIDRLNWGDGFSTICWRE